MMRKYVFFIVVSGMCSISCQNDLGKVNALFEERDVSVEIGKDVSLIYSDSGKVVLELQAPEMIRHIDQTDLWQEFSGGIAVDFYDKDGNINSHLIADYAIRRENEEKVIARDNVILFNFNGDTLKTEELIWSQKEKRIYSDQFVRISTPKEILYGFGFETEPSFSTFSLNEISGRMEVDNLPKD